MVEQELRRLLRLPEHRRPEGGLPAIVDPLRVRAALEQHPHRLRVVVVGGEDQQAVARTGGEVRGHAALEASAASSCGPPLAREIEHALQEREFFVGELHRLARCRSGIVRVIHFTPAGDQERCRTTGKVSLQRLTTSLNRKPPGSPSPSSPTPAGPLTNTAAAPDQRGGTPLFWSLRRLSPVQAGKPRGRSPVPREPRRRRHVGHRLPGLRVRPRMVGAPDVVQPWMPRDARDSDAWLCHAKHRGWREAPRMCRRRRIGILGRAPESNRTSWPRRS